MIILAPLHLGGVPLWSFSIAVFLLAASFSFYWFSAPAAKRLPVIHTALDRWVIAYLLFFLLSSLQTKIFYNTLVEWYTLGFVLAAFIATLVYCQEEKKIWRLGTILSLLGASLSLVGLLQYVGGLPHPWWHKPFFLSSVYVNHNHFAGLLEILLPLSLGFVFAEKDRAKKVALLYMSGLMGAAILFSLSRGGLISITGGLLFMLFLLLKKGIFRKGWWVLIVMALLVVCALFVFGLEPIVERLETLKKLGQGDLAAENRPLIWQGSVHLISKNLFFGAGPGTFAYSFLPFRPDGFTGRPGHTHNDYLHLLADCGLFAFLAVLGIFSTLVWKGLALVQKDTHRWKVCVGSGCLAAIFSLGVHSFVDFNFHIPANFMMFGILSGILFSLDRPPNTDLITNPKSNRRYAVSMGLIALLVMSFFLGVSHFFHWKGEKNLWKGDYEAARRNFNQSLLLNRLDPSAYFLRGLTSMRQAKETGQKDKSFYERAILDFDQAIRLNPLEPYYDYNRARAYRKLLNQKDLSNILKWYDASVRKDPKDPKLLFLVGKDLLTLSQTAKNASVERQAKRILARSVDLDPASAVSLYEVLWKHGLDIRQLENFAQHTKLGLKGLLQFLETADLWQFHREFFLKSLDVPIRPQLFQEKLDPVKWRRLDIEEFKSISGKKIHAGPLIYRNGEITLSVKTEGQSRLVLKARSRRAGASFGYILVKLDRKVVNALYLDSAFPREYLTFLNEKAGTHTIGIQYLNDKGEYKGQDRNVWIEEVWIG